MGRKPNMTHLNRNTADSCWIQLTSIPAFVVFNMEQSSFAGFKDYIGRGKHKAITEETFFLISLGVWKNPKLNRTALLKDWEQAMNLNVTAAHTTTEILEEYKSTSRRPRF